MLKCLLLGLLFISFRVFVIKSISAKSFLMHLFVNFLPSMFWVSVSAPWPRRWAAFVGTANTNISHQHCITTYCQQRVVAIHSDSDNHYNGGPMLDPQWHVKETWGH